MPMESTFLRMVVIIIKEKMAAKILPSLIAKVLIFYKMEEIQVDCIQIIQVTVVLGILKRLITKSIIYKPLKLKEEIIFLN